jgi:hypothetical protein
VSDAVEIRPATRGDTVGALALYRKVGFEDHQRRLMTLAINPP